MNLHFEGGLPYTPMLKMGQFAIVRDNLSHLKSLGLKIGLNAYIWTLSDMKKTDFQNVHF